ncbi:MAG: L-2-amino-thiazoline-4-carboxylic acid hydrolase [Actinomycetia bacterium]|nr:L-2-amino-thiazoline-4-carboxylic acid hydrolase [Actinomycetes bacterium]
MEDTARSALEQSRAETRSAFENRALMYAYIYDELEAEIGAERATALMKRAIFRRGLEIGQKYRPAAEAGDLAEVGRLFVEGSPAEGALFEPAVEEFSPDSDTILLRMTACPLKDAWLAAGYSAEKADLLCDISAAVDEGTFQGAGLDLRFLDRQACPGSEKCLLELKLR